MELHSRVQNLYFFWSDETMMVTFSHPFRRSVNVPLHPAWRTFVRSKSGENFAPFAGFFCTFHLTLFCSTFYCRSLDRYGPLNWDTRRGAWTLLNTNPRGEFTGERTKALIGIVILAAIISDVSPNLVIRTFFRNRELWFRPSRTIITQSLEATAQKNTPRFMPHKPPKSRTRRSMHGRIVPNECIGQYPTDKQAEIRCYPSKLWDEMSLGRTTC